MPRHKGIPMKRTSVSVNPDLHKLCVEYNISFSTATERGIMILLKERNEVLPINKPQVMASPEEQAVRKAWNPNKEEEVKE